MSPRLQIHDFRVPLTDTVVVDSQTFGDPEPEIVNDHTALDGPKPGPWADRPGFDPVLQAATGIQVRYGGKDGRPVLHGWASCIDYLTGYSGTFGIVLALLRAKRNGSSGALVRTSLAQGAQLVQAPFMFSSREHQAGGEPHGQDAVGEHSVHRIYRANDGWLFLGGTVEDLPKLAGAEGLEAVPIARDREDERARFLEGRIGQGRVEQWVAVLVKAGFGCHRVDEVEDLRRMYLHDVTADSAGAWDDGRSISAIRVTDHPVGSSVDICPPVYARFKNTSLKLCDTWPTMGADSREILKEIGFGDAGVDDLVARGVVKERFHESYLPS